MAVRYDNLKALCGSVVNWLCNFTFHRPVVFSLDGDSLYEADFVLATLMDRPLSSQGDHQMRTPARDENSSCAVR